MTLSSLLRITPRLVPTAARRSTRAASSVAGTSQGNKTLDSILIANRGEIALYV
jgi:3-methylcrotonyl-CoA carboxylase alpha subunit